MTHVQSKSLFGSRVRTSTSSHRKSLHKRRILRLQFHQLQKKKKKQHKRTAICRIKLQQSWKKIKRKETPGGTESLYRWLHFVLNVQRRFLPTSSSAPAPRCGRAVSRKPRVWSSQKLPLSEENFKEAVSRKTSENLLSTGAGPHRTAGSEPDAGATVASVPNAATSAKWVSQDLL